MLYSDDGDRILQIAVTFLRWFEELAEYARKRTIPDSFEMEKWVSNLRTIENRWFRLQRGNFFLLQTHVHLHAYMRRLRKETNQPSNCKYRGGVSILKIFDRYKKKNPHYGGANKKIIIVLTVRFSILPVCPTSKNTMTCTHSYTYTYMYI